MKYDLVIVGGGRKKEDRKKVRSIMNSLQEVLSDGFKVGKVWLDEHGGWWLEDKNGLSACAFWGGGLVKVGQQELVIGGEELIDVGMVWPVFSDKYDISVGVADTFLASGIKKIGSSGIMRILSSEMDILKLLVSDLKFPDKSFLVTNKDWYEQRMQIEDQILKKFKFPVNVCFGQNCEKVSIFENLSNVIYSIFDKNKYQEIRISNYRGEVKKIMTGFVGRKNFLPAVVAEKKSMGEWEVYDCKERVREIQTKIIDFVKRYSVDDFALWYINDYPDGWEIEKIDLFPDFGRSSDFVRLWQLGGMNYQDLIKKIYLERVNN